jgi:hypothetical protein
MPITKINSLSITYPLAFSAGTVSLPSITTSGDLNTGAFFPAADTIAFTEGGTEAMRIDSSARVGIGVTSPNQRLQLPENTNVGFNGGTNNAKIGGIIFGTDANFVRYGMIDSFRTSDAANIDLRFYTMAGDVGGVLERMRITNGGNLLVNATADIGPAKIVARQTVTDQSAIGCLHTVGANQTFIAFANAANDAIIGTIKNSGNTGVAYNTTSDYRLKENVNYNFDAITRLKQLKPARFNFIVEPNRTVDGFLAHEVSDIIPEAIIGEKDEIKVWREGEELPEGVSIGDNKLDENGNTIPIYQGIDQSKLTPILTKALQEAIAKIESLEARLTALESK